ncbi:response regulator transcription factor [Halovenus marina]|uniref:response regulator transcription factor n=1 Tax=Halovenus marina TaxID=3396621 RepID=UPI003F55FE8E
MSSETETATVLIVDDERNVADVYALRLDEYDTRVAYSGEEALEQYDETVDVVLLDRRMPDLSGREVLEQIRARNGECRVIMLTAVDPGLDIIEMPFDEYLCKPIDKADLVDAIERQRAIQQYDEQVSEYLELTAKLATLESEHSPQRLDEHDGIARLRERAERLKSEMDGTLGDVDVIERSLRDIDETEVG